MKILFDQGTPVPLRKTLAPHSVSTAFEMGWAEVENGDLLAAAEKVFDAAGKSPFSTSAHPISKAVETECGARLFRNGAGVP